LIWRLDVWRDGCNGHAIFDLRKDCTPETIRTRFASLDASMEYWLDVAIEKDVDVQAP
jgi:hypothetical protein